MALTGRCISQGWRVDQAKDRTWSLQQPEEDSTTNSNIETQQRSNLGKLAIKVLLQDRGLVTTMLTLSPDFCHQEMTWVKNRHDFASSLVCGEKNHRHYGTRKFHQPIKWWLPSKGHGIMSTDYLIDRYLSLGSCNIVSYCLQLICYSVYILT